MLKLLAFWKRGRKEGDGYDLYLFIRCCKLIFLILNLVAEFDKALNNLCETKSPVCASKIQTIAKLALKPMKVRATPLKIQTFLNSVDPLQHYKNVMYIVWTIHPKVQSGNETRGIIH